MENSIILDMIITIAVNVDEYSEHTLVEYIGSKEYTNIFKIGTEEYSLIENDRTENNLYELIFSSANFCIRLSVAQRQKIITHHIDSGTMADIEEALMLIKLINPDLLGDD